MATRDGQLFVTNDGYPRAAQPGGQGTPVTDPVQAPGEINTTRFYLGCGHCVTRYDVKQERAAVDEPAEIAGQLVKRLCCPSCGYIQRSMLVSQYNDNFFTPVLF